MNGSSRIPGHRGPHWLPTGRLAPEAGAGGPEPRRPHTLSIPVAVLGLSLSACVETGDFGRPTRGVWNDLVLPSAGVIAAARRGEPASAYPFTDLEEELRDRAWRFLMPAHERAWFDRSIANLARTRILPARNHPSDPAGYYRALMSEPFVSPASRFRRIGDDASADLRLIEPFTSVAMRVIEADRARLRSLGFVRDLSEEEIGEARARVVENRCLIAWVRAELHERTASYRYALEHAFVAMPQIDAVETERSVRRLDLHRRSLDALPVPAWANGACLDAPALVPLEAPRPLVTKG